MDKMKQDFEKYMMLTSCWQNTSEAWIQKHQLHVRVLAVMKRYYGYLSLPVALLGFFLSILFIAVVYQSIIKNRVSRKCYGLIINRSIGDLMACMASIVGSVYVLFSNDADIPTVFFIDAFAISSFWSAMVSYCSLSIIKLYAVARPMDYKKSFTARKCYFIAVFSWIIFLAIISIHLLLKITLWYEPLRQWTGCKIETCVRRVFQIQDICFVVIFGITVLCYILAACLIFRAQRFSRSFYTYHPQSFQKRYPMWKLSLNVATFTVFNSAYIVWIFFMIVESKPCEFQYQLDHMMHRIGYCRFLLLLRIVIDPAVSFATDSQIRKTARQMLGVKSGISNLSATTYRRDTTLRRASQTEGDVQTSDL